jgi:iron-sulfur cluster repair protein YtfE (RIC family)
MPKNTAGKKKAEICQPSRRAGRGGYMTGLMEELKNEHVLLLGILDEVKALGISSPAGRKRLLSAKDLLLSHITKEDERFYPALKKAAENNAELRRTLEYFAADMETVTKKAEKFFQKYAHGGSETEFGGDLKILYVTLKDRIRVEEEIIFAKHEQLA